MHDGDPVRDVAYHGEVVGNKQIGELQLLLEVYQKIDHLGLNGNVQCRNGLVADEEPGIDGKCPGDADPLSLPSGKFMRISLKDVFMKPHHLKELTDPLESLSLRPLPVNDHGLLDDCPNSSPGVERPERILKHHLYASANVGERTAPSAADIDALETDAPGVGLFKGQNELGQSRLPTARFPHESQCFVRMDVQINAVHRDDRAG